MKHLFRTVMAAFAFAIPLANAQVSAPPPVPATSPDAPRPASQPKMPPTMVTLTLEAKPGKGTALEPKIKERYLECLKASNAKPHPDPSGRRCYAESQEHLNASPWTYEVVLQPGRPPMKCSRECKLPISKGNTVTIKAKTNLAHAWSGACATPANKAPAATAKYEFDCVLEMDGDKKTGLQ